MTELFIDGTAVVLPADFSLTVRSENPYFTKNGEYTYELTLPLDNPVNSEMYRHLKRLNSVDQVKENRQALLLADNRVYCKGKEVITSWSDSSVSIQIVSGNSELNYLLKGTSEKYISQLDMGVADIPSNLDLTKDDFTPDMGFCLIPVQSGDRILNNFGVRFTLQNTPITETAEITSEYIYPTENIYAQPFLFPYLEKMLMALGYSSVVNELDDKWKYVVLCQDSDPREYSKMFYGWKVGDFIEAVETLFNLCLIVNPKDNSVHIFLRSSMTAKYGVTYLEVEDEYESDDEDIDVDDVTSKNVRIQPASSEYYNLQHLDSEFIEKNGVLKVPTQTDIYKLAEGNNNYDKTLFYTEDKGRFYTLKYDTPEQTYKFASEVNEFGDIVREEDGDDVTLKAIPSDYAGVPYIVETKMKNQQTNLAVMMDGQTNSVVNMPGSKDDDEEEEVPTNLYDQIKEGKLPDYKEESSSSTLYVTLYTGKRSIMYSLGITVLDGQHTWTSMAFPQVMLPVSFNVGSDFEPSLRTVDLDKELWTRNESVNMDNAVKFTSHDVNMPDPKSIFVIRNKAYTCKYIEYTLDKNGRKSGWTGVFFPYQVKQGDTVDVKWILSDGCWRDEGVWLDDGRWID